MNLHNTIVNKNKLPIQQNKYRKPEPEQSFRQEENEQILYTNYIYVVYLKQTK